MLEDWQARLHPVCSTLGLALRPERHESDASFVDALYASTRREELAQTGWSEEAILAFLVEQSRLQKAHYLRHYPDASYLLFLAGQQPVGRLYLHRQRDELRVMDIALLPRWRDQGRGTALMQALLELSRSRGWDVTLHVESFNAAGRLYERLGFEEVEMRGIHRFMRWSPSGTRCRRT